MYDLNNLEKRWVDYKRAKHKRLFLLSAAFLAVAVVSAFISYLVFVPRASVSETKTDVNGSVTQRSSKSQNNSVSELNDSVSEPKLEKTSEPQREIVIISPKMDNSGFVNPQPITPLSFEELPSSQRQTPVQQPSQWSQPQSQPPQSFQPQLQPAQQVQPKPQPKISIETKPADTIAILEDRYKKNESINAALLLCDEYYKKGEYEKALSWAIKANSLDAKNEKSWILFAKSSAKLGRKSDAINALESYLRTNDSDSVRAVLRQIRSDEI